MKKNISSFFFTQLLLIIAITFQVNYSLAQAETRRVCKGEIVQLELSGYAGNLEFQWQVSNDSKNWIEIPNAKYNRHAFTAYVNEFYRCLIREEKCTYFSDTSYIKVDTLIPYIKSPANITDASFDAQWTNVLGAMGYIIDIATDQNFYNWVEFGSDVGDMTEYSVNSLNCNSKYYYRVRAYFNDTRDSLGCYSVIMNTATDTCPTPDECTIISTCNGDIIDARDNQVYKTVQIGTQCWMRQNLNIGTMIQGTAVSTSGSDNQNTSIEKYCYENSLNNCKKFGGLYMWDEMMAYGSSKSEDPGPRGICPTGWHVPTDNEWRCLENKLSGMYQAGGKLKDSSTWASPNYGATNSSGFSALAAGARSYYGGFYDKEYGTYFFTATEGSPTFPYYRYIYYWGTEVYNYTTSKVYNGYSVRCLKD